jgi:hypothetical protein
VESVGLWPPPVLGKKGYMLQISFYNTYVRGKISYLSTAAIRSAGLKVLCLVLVISDNA